MNKFRRNKETGEYEYVIDPYVEKLISAVYHRTPKQMRTKEPQLSLEKQRRSRINWFELVPADVAQAQVDYERRVTVLAMCDAGLLLKDIGDLFGCTGSNVARMRDKQIRDKKQGRSTPPAERYIAARERSELDEAHSRAKLGRMAIAARDLTNVKGRDWLYV